MTWRSRCTGHKSQSIFRFLAIFNVENIQISPFTLVSSHCPSPVTPCLPHSNVERICKTRLPHLSRSNEQPIAHPHACNRTEDHGRPLQKPPFPLERAKRQSDRCHGNYPPSRAYRATPFTGLQDLAAGVVHLEWRCLLGCSGLPLESPEAAHQCGD